jgi:hypothetical protein
MDLKLMSIGPYQIRSENKVKSLISKLAFDEGQILSTIPNENLYQRPSRYTVQIGQRLHTEVAHLSALNHSCDPNVILDTSRMLVVARREIKAGDELTFFYPSTEWEMAAPFICLCGASNCIHVVAGARFLPFSTLEQHYLNRHIRELIVDALNGTESHLSRLEEAKLVR